MRTIDVRVGDEQFDVTQQPRTNTRLTDLIGGVFHNISIRPSGNVDVGLRVAQAYSSAVEVDGRFSIESNTWGDYLHFEMTGPLCEMKIRGKQNRVLIVRQTNE